MAKRDFYEVLGVAKSATADEIRKAHRKLVRQFHPDVNKSNPKTEEKFKEVQEAYDVLSDAEKRKKYDQFGHAGLGAGFPPESEAYESFRRQARGRGGSRTWQAGPNVSVEDFDFSQSAGFGDIFDQLFGGRGAQATGRAGARPRMRPEPQRGADVEHKVTLSFEQAARGTTLPLQINRDGRMETIEVKIPPGVKDGSRVRIKGRGQHAHGEPGDLYIVTQVQPHPWFRREGELDIAIDLPISIWEAMLGAKVDVPTLEGPVTLTIPPGTGSHSKMRIRARGIERGDQQGDQFVIVKVVAPRALDEDDKAAIEKLARKHPINARADMRW